MKTFEMALCWHRMAHSEKWWPPPPSPHDMQICLVARDRYNGTSRTPTFQLIIISQS